MAQGKVMETVVKLMGSIDPSLAKSIASAEKNFKTMNKAILTVNKSLLAVGAAATTAGAAMATHLIKSGNEYMRTMNNMSAQTGLTGKELKEFEGIAREVWKSGKGENLQEVADALVNIEQASGLAGEELKKAANSGLLLKDTFGFEISESSRAASALMKNFGISAEEAYGIIAVGAQNGANKNGDLLDTLNEYSVHYKALGLDADQFVQSLISGAEAGSFSIDKVGDAVKEFTIRSKDGSDATMEAFKQIGLDAKTMTAAFSMGGDEANVAFFKTVEALNAMEDPFQRNAAGIALFGTMFEDLEAGVLDTLASMGGASVEATDALRQMEKVKYRDLGYALTKIGRTMQDALLPAAQTIGQAIFDIMPEIQASMTTMVPAITALGQGFVDMLPTIVGLIKQVMPVITQLVTQLTPFITEVFGKFGEILTMIGPHFATLVGEILPPLMTIVQALLPPLMQILEGILPPLIELVTALAPIISVLATMLGSVLTQAINLLMPMVQNIINVFSNLLNFITNVFTFKWGEALMNIVNAAGNIFALLGRVIATPLNIVIGLINTVISGLNMIQLPDWVPVIGGKGLNIPQIPMLASGGFTDGVSIAGEAGTEAVISFDPAYRAKNIETWLKAGELLGVGSSSSGDTYNLGGFTFAPKVYASEAVSAEDIINRLKSAEGEFFDFVDEWMERKKAGNYKSSSYAY